MPVGYEEINLIIGMCYRKRDMTGYLSAESLGERLKLHVSLLGINEIFICRVCGSDCCDKLNNICIQIFFKRYE